MPGDYQPRISADVRDIAGNPFNHDSDCVNGNGHFSTLSISPFPRVYPHVETFDVHVCDLLGTQVHN